MMPAKTATQFIDFRINLLLVLAAMGVVTAPAALAAGPLQAVNSGIAGRATLPGSSSCTDTLQAGYKVTSYNGTRVAIWYPTSAKEAFYQYPGIIGINGSVAMNAAPETCDSFPLILFSHGDGGCSIQSVFMTEQLARAGYVVIAPDYEEDAGCSADGSPATPNNANPAFTDPTAWNSMTALYRYFDSENALNGILSDSTFLRSIDSRSIGAIGHSLGGYTVLAMLGGWSNWKDSRIKAGLLLSPWNQPFQQANTLGAVAMPTMYQGGTQDLGITPTVAMRGGAYDTANPAKFFAELDQGTMDPTNAHLGWTNLACQQLGAPSVSACLADPAANTSLINNYGFAFLDQYLKGKGSPLLTGTGAGLADYRTAEQ